MGRRALDGTLLRVHRFAYLAGFALSSSAGVVFVLLSDLQDRYALPSWGIGAIASAGFIAGLAIQLVVAPFADRGGLFRIGLFAFAFGIGGTIWFIAASTLWPLVAARTMLGLGLGLFDLAARKALVGEAVTGSGARLGSYLSANVAGFILGPLLGAVLSPLGFNAPFVAVGVLTAVAAGPALRWLRSAPIATAEPGPGEFLVLLRHPALRAAMLAQFVIFGNIGIFDSVVDVYLTDLGAENATIGLILVAIGAPLVTLPTFAGRWVERVGPRRVLVPLLCAAVPAIAGFGLFPIILTVVLAGLLQGTVEATMFPTTQLLALEVTGPGRAAVGQAMLGTIGLGAAGVTAFIAPSIYEAFGARWLFAGMAGLTVIAAAAAARELRVID